MQNGANFTGHRNPFPVKLQRAATSIVAAGIEIVPVDDDQLVHWSSKGLPHLVGIYKDIKFAAVWIKHLKKYRIIFPYNSFRSSQSHAHTVRPANLPDAIERAYTCHLGREL